MSKSIIIYEIISFIFLKKNWDGHDASKVMIIVIINTTWFIMKLNKHYVKLIYDFYPNPDGTISIEWGHKIGSTISLEVGKYYSSYYTEIGGTIINKYDNIKLNKINKPILLKSIDLLYENQSNKMVNQKIKSVD